MNELAAAVMRNGSEPLSPLHLFNYMGGIVFFVYFFSGRSVLCVGGCHMCSGRQSFSQLARLGFVCAQKGDVVVVFLRSNFYSLCLVLSSAKLALLEYLSPCLFLGYKSALRLHLLIHELEHKGKMVPGLDSGGALGIKAHS